MALTKQDIFRTADELDAEGIRPTLQAVRKRLGKGSFTTISDAMSEWKSHQSTATAPAEPLTEAILEELTQAGLSLWRMALDAADKRLEDARQQLATERESMEAHITEATEVTDSLSRENEALRKELEDLRRQTDEELARRAGDIEVARKEVQEARERAARMEGQVSALKEQFEALTTTKSEVEKSAETSPVPGKTTPTPAPVVRQ